MGGTSLWRWFWRRPKARRESTPAWLFGEVILDLYKVGAIRNGVEPHYAEGGMGRVYRVRHLQWNVDLAVKVPLAEKSATESDKENFTRECETWMSLGLHPHVVSCHYVRRLGDVPVVFAEYLEGGSLRDWIDTRKLYDGGPESALARILDIAIQSAWGLHHAHEAGVVHQDVKPANILLAADGTAKVTDFGVARARAESGKSTWGDASQSLLASFGGGTPAYCSPEQAVMATLGGRPSAGPLSLPKLTRRTDVWSWAVSVLEMFTGENPASSKRPGPAAAAALDEYANGRLEVVDGAPKVPAAMLELLRRCLRRQTDERPSGMQDIAEQLKEIYRAVTGRDYWRREPRAVELRADSLNNRAISLFDLGRDKEAEKLLDAALEADPSHLEATYNRGLHLWRTGRMTDEVFLQRMRRSREAYQNDLHPVQWTRG